MVNVMKKIILVLTASLIASSASAHAYLVSAVPAVGSTVSTPPTELTLKYTERVEPHFSQVQVLNSKGEKLSLGKLQLAGDGGRIVTVALPKLSPGSYTVVWHMTAADTHKTHGKFDFKVAP
jgi:methionine-rich copper-binding protein CopC